MERCESLGRMLERVCCGPASLDDDAVLAPLLFLSPYFAALRDAAYSKRLARLIIEPSRCRSAEEKSYLVRNLHMQSRSSGLLSAFGVERVIKGLKAY
jgi:hypothetical protein